MNAECSASKANGVGCMLGEHPEGSAASYKQVASTGLLLAP